jgi:hypothetical protein
MNNPFNQYHLAQLFVEAHREELARAEKRRRMMREGLKEKRSHREMMDALREMLQRR